MGSKYKQSPIGIFRHCWVNKADTKYNAEGLFHTELILRDEAALEYKAEVDALVDAAWAEETKEMTPADAKKWGKYYPYEEEKDEQGVTTGAISFKYKQNALIHLKDGGTKKVTIGIRDGRNKPTKSNVFGGAEGRVLYSSRNTKIATAKQFGVRLDFSMVQLLKEALNTGGGFDEVEGAYTDGTPTQEQKHEEY